jgi:hypothetical protein
MNCESFHEKQEFPQTPMFVCTSSTIFDNVTQFSCVWRGNPYPAKSCGSNKQVNDGSKGRKLCYGVPIRFHMSMTYKARARPCPCPDRHSGRCFELLTKVPTIAADHGTLHRATTNSAFRLVKLRVVARTITCQAARQGTRSNPVITTSVYTTPRL